MEPLDKFERNLIIVAIITCLFVCFVCVWAGLSAGADVVDRGSPTLEGDSPQNFSGVVVRGRFVPSHVESVPVRGGAKMQIERRSYGSRWYLTIGDARSESEWEVSEKEYMASRRGAAFTVTNRNFKPPFLGIAAD